MNRNPTTPLSPPMLAGLAGVAVLTSVLVAVGVLYLVRRGHGGMSEGSGDHALNGHGSGDHSGTVPIQPGIIREMPAHVPHHFTEELIVPGFTETGQDVEQQDDELGRSPEGV